MIASVGELWPITVLIITVLGFIALMTFKAEVRQILGRLSRFEAKRKDTTISADLTGDLATSPDDESVSAAVDKTEDPLSPEEGAVLAADSPSVKDADTAESVRKKMVAAYFSGNESEGDEFFARLTSLESDPGERKQDHVRRLAAKFISGIDTRALDELRALADDQEIASTVYMKIGMCLDATEKPGEAAEAFKLSFERAGTTTEKAEALEHRAASLTKAGELDLAIKELSTSLANETGREVKQILWQSLAAIYKKSDELELQALSLHEVAKLAGNDATKWFDAGYAFSQAHADRFSLLVIQCYSTALSFRADFSAARNNLGVALERSGLHIPGTEEYKAAAELGNTLAMANMADKFLQMGFAEDAKGLIDTAGNNPNPADKIAQVNARLATERTTQRKSLQKIKDDGPRAGEFLTRCLNERFRSMPDLGSQWSLGEIQVTINVSGASVVATWDDGGFVGKHRFRGTAVGATLHGTFEDEEFSTATSVSWKLDGYGYGIVSHSAEMIEFRRFSGQEVGYMDICTQPVSKEHHS